MSKKDPRVTLFVTELNASIDRMTSDDFAQIETHIVSKYFPPDVEQLIEELTPMPAGGEMARELTLNLRQAIKAGFMIAVARYMRELRQNQEAMAIIGARVKGGELGRASASRRREELARRIREKWAEMEAAGLKVTNDTVAEAMKNDGWKCSRSTVIRAFKSKPTKRTKR